MKPINVGDNKRLYIDEHNEKDSRFKVGVIELEYLNSKIYLLKNILLIGVLKYLLLIK